MNIKTISISNDGYIHCKSNFYSSQDILNNENFNFEVGINKLIGEIDSGIWAISYLLSMYNHRPEDFVLFEQPKVTINNKCISLNELSEFSCYMDRLDPLFSSNHSVKELVMQGLEYSKIKYTVNDIKKLFSLDDQRFERPLSGVGNEIFRAMSAIAVAYNKQIFCFPWLSNKRFESYHENLTTLLQILKSLEKTVIIPVGISPKVY